jgi:sugar phosphate permease
MIGFAGLAANVGAVLAQTPLVYAANLFGWRKTFVFMGFAMVIFSVLTALFVKNDPKDMGLPSCKRQLLFHKYRQLIFHKKRQLKFHTYRNHFIFCKFHFVCGFMENSA